jgi:phospholipase C
VLGTLGLAAVALASGVVGPGRGARGSPAAAPAWARPVLAALGHSELRTPGSLPDPARAAGTDTLPGVSHIVVLMLENHTFDNLFGMLGRGDGLARGRNGAPTATNPYPDGKVQHAFHMPTTCQLSSTPSQEWAASHNAYDNGRNDGFVRTPISPATTRIVGGVAMGYWTGADLPFTYSLASTFPIADRWFSSALAQTDPERRFLVAATAAGMTDDIGTSPGNAVPDAGLATPDPTIFNELDTHGISWTDYAASYPTGATPELFPVTDGPTEALHHAGFDQFYSDSAAGKLPSFTLLDPDYGTQSQENPQNIAVGEGLLARVVDALGSSPLWPSTMLVVTYDEGGGYYDHVPPPAALAPDAVPPMVQPGEASYDGYARYGFRVPAVIVSSYAKRGYVSHRLYDHTSILAMVERKWNLPALTYRDANANDLTDFLDLGALARHAPTFPKLPGLAPPGDTPAALACSKTGPGTVPPPGSVTS